MLKKIIGCVVVAALYAATPYVANAGGKVLKRERWDAPGQGWVIDYTPETNSCGLGRIHTNGVHLQIFYVPENRQFVLTLFSNQWQQIRDNDYYQAVMVMDGGADRWQGTGSGVWANDGTPGIVFGGLSTDFMASFMRRNRVDIYDGKTGQWRMAFSLDGSANAMSSMIACLQAHDSGSARRAPPVEQQVRRFTM